MCSIFSLNVTRNLGEVRPRTVGFHGRFDGRQDSTDKAQDDAIQAIMELLDRGTFFCELLRIRAHIGSHTRAVEYSQQNLSRRIVGSAKHPTIKVIFRK